MSAVSRAGQTRELTLTETLARRLSEHGPISVADFMEACLYDPDLGYYRVGEPLGRDGDFITSPEVSQIFGELVGLWAAETWRQMGSPAAVRLIELGPGRGTLMADALRACRRAPEFLANLHLHFVETSQTLRSAQEIAIKPTGIQATWHERLDDVPAGPSIVIANEFFDALPIRQFVLQDGAWRERCIEQAADGGFAFCDRELILAESAPAPPAALAAVPGDIFEIRPGVEAVVESFARRAADHGFAALIIDYGHLASACGDTLQAVRGHRPADPLELPGETDLTAHVDFEAMARNALDCGLQVWGPLSQQRFLLSLGLAQRCTALIKTAGSTKAQTVKSAAERLIDPEQMGTLFKVIALCSRGLEAPPGFPSQWRPQQFADAQRT